VIQVYLIMYVMMIMHTVEIEMFCSNTDSNYKAKLHEVVNVTMFVMFE